MNIKNINIGKLIPYKKNAKKHPKEQIEHIANSIKEFGFKQPVVIDSENNIVVGHARVLAAKKLGMVEVPCVIADDLNEEQIKALRLADNKTNESDWDMALLDAELEDIFNIDMSLFGFDEDVNAGAYYDGVISPTYEIKGDTPDLSELVDGLKAGELIAEIEASDVDEDIRAFLIKAAYRHYVFNYGKIAEYYAAAPKEVQDLMERSALVIIDYNKAIEYGFVRLHEYITGCVGDVEEDDEG